jgi:hypothetical protein
MLNFSLLGNAMGVGGQKSKGIRRVALVLRQMKSDASNRIPHRVAAFQIRRRPARGLGDGGMNMSIQLVPQPCQDRAIQILQAPHRRRPFRQRGPLGFRRLGNRYGGSILQVRIVTQRGEEPLGNAAPKDEGGRQRLMQEPGRQRFQTARGRGPEGLGQARGGRGAEFRFSLVVRFDK